ncbi:MAG: Sua5/YciO/YrdC/YwlC family protein [Mariprofundus sp.]
MHRPRQSSLASWHGNTTSAGKMAALLGAHLLNNGGLVAHQTATLPGIAAAVHQQAALQRLIRFKQRRGPFLLLADSVRTAASLARYYSPALRVQMRAVWPGPVTLVFAARPGLPGCCYHKGFIAVRVDGSLQTRQLARLCGGLLLSSSLNRRGDASLKPGRKMQLRYRRFVRGRVAGPPSSGRGSTLIRVRGNHSTVIRR